MPNHWLGITGAVRILVIVSLLLMVHRFQPGLDSIGLVPDTFRRGLFRGALWSILFAALASLFFAGCYIAGINPIALFRVPLPETGSGIVSYFLVGAALAPIAEEIYFRGIIYGYLRRWDPVVAVVGSTLLFVAAHPNLQQLPITQIVGGIVFAISYEVEKNLMVPIFIHTTGNLALFSLSL